MDNIRGIVGCPAAGLTPKELVDTAPIAAAFQRIFLGNREFTNLPRKFNVTITGCPDNCTAAETQDVALTPALDGAGVAGFNLAVGGKQGSGGPRLATGLDAFVRPAEAADVCAGVAFLFRDHGPREHEAALAGLPDRGVGGRAVPQGAGSRLGRPLPPPGATRGAGSSPTTSACSASARPA